MEEEIRTLSDRFRDIWNHPLRTPVITGVVAFAGGTGLGYFLGRRTVVEVEELPEQLKIDFNVESAIKNQVADIERETPRVIVSEEALKAPVVDLEDEEEADDGSEDSEEPVADFIRRKLQEDLKEASWHTKEHEVSITPVEEEVVTNNVFAGNDESWDYQAELQTRTSTRPYILHKDEFWAEELDYSQTTLTYYAGDDILVDQEDSPIYNHEQVVGKLNFGHGSGDPNVVYIRNDKLKAEYEVIRLEGLYSVEVLGLEIENNERAREKARDQTLKHSDHKGLRLE